MAGKTYAIHTTEEIIRRVDQHAERIRRSRNSLIVEGIEILLEIMDKDYIDSQDGKHRNKKKEATK